MFRPIKTKRVYEEIVAQIRQLISDGTLNPGDKLMSERELADRLRVSRASVREALSVLEILGLIESRPGDGTFIKETTSESLVEPLALILLRERDSAQELMEVRKILEVEAAALAAARATEEDLQKIEEILGMMDNGNQDLIGDRADAMFHLAVAEAAHNAILARLMNTLSDTLLQSLRVSRQKILMEDPHSKVFLNHHREIFGAIKNHDQNAARETMKRHLNFVSREIWSLEEA